MKTYRLAQRYAKAIFALSVEQQIETTIGDDMMLIADTIEHNKGLSKALQSPIIPFHKKKNILQAIFADKVNALSIRFMTLVAKKDREAFLVYFAKAYADIYKAHIGVKEAWVTTAKPLEKNLQQHLTAYLKKVSGAQQLKLHNSVNEKLIGGFVLKMDSAQYDTSIKNMLLRLRQELISREGY